MLVRILLPHLVFAIGYLLSFVSTGSADHAIHISKCEILLNEESHSFEVALHIYADDLQTILSQRGAPLLHISSDRESIKADSFITAYLREKLQIKADAKPLAFQFVGKEPSEDFIALWCYLEFPSVPDYKKLSIRYDLLMDLYEDQKNIVHLKARGKKGYLLLHPKHPEEELNNP
jgi:hypothetical protein